MARLASNALGGFYPTPQHIVSVIGSHIHVPDKGLTLLDPCAGEGKAVLGLAQYFAERVPNNTTKSVLYAIEMEKSRYATLDQAARSQLGWSQNVLHSDAFHVVFGTSEWKNGVSVLWLNPPYDYDRKWGRLETKFLARFTDALAPGGVLVYLVPYYALTSAATILGTSYQDLQCYRFPGTEFDAYKQVCLFATKLSNPLVEPDSDLVSMVSGWADNPGTIPELAEGTLEFEAPGAKGLHVTKKQLDVATLLKEVQPWHTEDIIPDIDLNDLLYRSYPLAMPPRPAHIAAGIAAGIFNGALIESEGKAPPVLIKGVFEREYETEDEKTDSAGNVTSVVQVQVPKLSTMVLDLTTNKYHVIRAGETPSGEPSIENWNTADILEKYGPSLMETMLRQCPVLFDPANPEHREPLAPSPRKLFEAQEDAVQAIIKLLGGLGCKDRKGKAALLLGEIGSGKSTIAMSAMSTLGFRRTLILCPPHLLDSWKEQAQAVVPGIKVQVLEDLRDVDALAATPLDRPIISLLSRETAKLGHGWDSVDHVCPKCGAEVPPGDNARTRARCAAKPLTAKTVFGELALDLARDLIAVYPKKSRVQDLVTGRNLSRYLNLMKGREVDHEQVWEKFVSTKLDAYIDRMLSLGPLSDVRDYVALLVAAAPTFARVERVVRLLLQSSGVYYQDRDTALALLLLLPQGEEQIQLAKTLEEEFPLDVGNWGHNYWRSWAQTRENLHTQNIYHPHLSFEKGVLNWDKHQAGTGVQLLALLVLLSTNDHLERGEACGEILFQASSSPKRLPLAKYITRQYPKLFDFIIQDESHEYSAEKSAQANAANRLLGLGIPTLAMTGSVMNGYADSLFNTLWALSPKFRAEFKRDERQAYTTRYGYHRRVLTEKDMETKEPVAFGTMSDRVEMSSRKVGSAPGVLPLLVLKHLLAISATLHKDDLALELPPNVEIPVPIKPSPELLASYTKLENALFERIQKDRFDPELSGKLWGQVSELPGYLDRCTADTGNTPEGVYEVRYPSTVGGALIASALPLPAETITPKEEWLLNKVVEELAEGRNVMVFCWHINVLPRMVRLLAARTGEKVAILLSDKVPTAKRQAWIDREVVKKNVRILVVNPVTVQTGLNNLIHFQTEFWLQNAACNPTAYRQAVGRVDRIGKKAETRIYFPYYTDTAQADMYKLLLHKVGVSLATDGLDAEATLRAAGIGTQISLSGTLGQQIYKMVQQRRG